MLPDLVADENVDFRIVKRLREYGLKVFSVAEFCPGISDQEVLNWARRKQALLVTEDCDFGEWVFAHHEPSLGVILLRYQYPDIQDITESLFKVITRYGPELYNKFTVVTVKKVRIRKI